MGKKYFVWLISLVFCFILSCEDTYYGNGDFTLLWGVAVADLDLDGAVDIVVTSTENDTDHHYVSVFLNDMKSPGSFLLSVEFRLQGPKRDYPDSITLGDLNDDGFLDITTHNTQAIFILFQDSTQPGQFFAPLKITVGKWTNSLSIGDLNEDGFNDLAISGNGPQLSILFQDSLNPGNFFPLVNLGITSSSVAIGDLNGDFINDMAVTVSSNRGKVQLLFQDPAVPGSFIVAMDLDAGAQATDVKMEDLDKDGNLDLIVGNFGTPGNYRSGSISVFLQDPAKPGEFLHADNYKFSDRVNEISIGDLNGDGFLDIAAAGGRITILFQDISSVGTFLPAKKYLSGDDTWSVAIGDMNEDNFNDLIFSDDVVTIRWQDPAAPGKFSRRTTIYDPD